MGTDNDRRIVKQIVQRLKRDRRGFGERPCSYYSQKEPEPFITHVLKLKLVRDLLPYSLAGEVGQDLSQEQQKQFKEIVERLDRYGELVEGWQQGRPGSQSCLDDLEERLKFWAFRNMPDYCWGLVNLSQVVDELMAVVKVNIGSYTYEEDLLVWAIPFFVGELWDQVEEVARQLRGSVVLVQLRERLQLRARRILSHIRKTYGIYGIEVDDVTERALLFVMRADDREYNAHRNNISEWALGKLVDQIKLRALFYSEPNMGPDWHLNPHEEAWERQKRRKLLQTFHDIV